MKTQGAGRVPNCCSLTLGSWWLCLGVELGQWGMGVLNRQWRDPLVVVELAEVESERL
ncbi:MAG: hypothetical protein NZ473_04010 [Candidatus Kapabacteria bacterium]|nr:hypothetical protein [Candidatus Kapabacteria bacterium]MDW8225559.1 hypothetical protein [Bacteroidota bacterium]